MTMNYAKMIDRNSDYPPLGGGHSENNLQNKTSSNYSRMLS